VQHPDRYGLSWTRHGGGAKRRTGGSRS
jgi:hypothetical protein